MTALLERERELAELTTLAREAQAGHGCLVVVEAQAGLGKTRLLQAAREHGEQAGLRVLSARATELERDFPFALVRQLFEPWLAAMSADERDALFEGASGAARSALGVPGAEPAADSFTVLHGLYWLTAALAERHPLLLALDDAHWADAGSLDYLGFLAPRIEELPILLAVACRPDEAQAAPALARITVDASVRRVSPRALSAPAATALLADELGARPDDAFATTCHEVSGGNPFLLRELARTLVAQNVSPAASQALLVRELAPERVTRTVALRLARLSRDARTVAHALVVLGDDSDPRLVADFAGLDLDAVRRGADELRGAAIFDPDASPRFIHPLARNAVRSELPAGKRAAEHARAARLLRDRGASPEQLAAHLVASEPSGDRLTVETLLRAGSHALASGAPQSAIAYLRRALREPPPDALRAPLLSQLFTASIRAVDHATFAEIEPDVMAELERTPALRGRWAMRLTGWLTMNGRVEEAIALLERGIEQARHDRTVDRVFRLEMQMTTLAQLSPEASRARLAPYRDRIRPDGATDRLAAAADLRWTMSHGTAEEAAELALRAMGPSGEILAEQPELMAAGEVVGALIAAERFDAAEAAVRHALAYARERGATPELAGAWGLSAALALMLGDLPAAEADARQAVGLARLSGLLPVQLALTPLLTLALTARGELDEAAAALDAIGMATAPIPDFGMLAMLRFGRGVMRLERGDPRGAADDFVELHERKRRRGIAGDVSLQAGACAGMALATCGERERALELAGEDVVHARRWGAPGPLCFALMAQGVAVGDSAGIELLEEAVAVTDGTRGQYRRAAALLMLGAALRRDNQRARAREPLREALDLARRSGAGGVARRASDELAATGERVRRWTPIGVESLTPSERRVAEMAAAGMTNRRIAQTLFLTVKTIETHLAAAYDKLGIRSRRELPEALGTLSPVAAAAGPTIRSRPDL
jgi:DNA-binding CsgD family transcriptional regulator